MKKYLTILICIIVCVLVACSNNKEEAMLHTTAEEGDHTEKELVISYDTKVYTPNILVSQFGYGVEYKKLVYFFGEELEDTFQVFEYDTDFLVYEGTIEATGEAGYYVGDFTELKKQGLFYIQTAKIGESFPFYIEEKQKWEDLYYILFKNIASQDPEKYKAIENLEELFPIFIAHEMYPTSFFDGNIYAEPNNVPDVLDYLDLVGLAISDTEVPINNVKEGFLEAAFFAKLANNFERYDLTKAESYQKLAIKRYQEAENLLSKTENVTDYESVAYFASAELYRRNGQYIYRIASEKYAANISAIEAESAITFYADMTHMSTRRNVRVDFCNVRMEALREHVIEWTENSGSNPFFYNTNDVDTLLLYGIETLWIHEINYSEEYEKLEQEISAYFTGLNTEGVSYISEIGYTISKDTFTNRPDLNNKYFVLICRHMQQEEKNKE